MDNLPRYGLSGTQYIQSKHTGLQVPYRTSQARDYMRLLDFSIAVTFYVGLPVIVLDESDLVFRPDFVVLSGAGRSIVVCVPNSGPPSDADIATWNAAARWCARRGYQFCKVTEDELYAGYRLDNVRRLELFADEAVTSEEEDMVLKVVRSSAQPLSVLRLLQELCSLGFERAMEVLMNMIYRHKLTIPVDESLLALDICVSLPGDEKTARR